MPPFSLMVPSGLRMLMSGNLVAQAASVIVRIVCRRHLHRAGAHFWVGQQAVGDDRDVAIRRAESVTNLADQMLIASSFGMHGHGGIAEHRLRPRRREADESRPARHLTG